MVWSVLMEALNLVEVSQEELAEFNMVMAFRVQKILCSKIVETHYIFFFSLQQHSNGAASRSTSCQGHCIYAPCHSENATEAGSNEHTIVQIAWPR